MTLKSLSLRGPLAQMAGVLRWARAVAGRPGGSGPSGGWREIEMLGQQLGRVSRELEHLLANGAGREVTDGEKGAIVAPNALVWDWDVASDWFYLSPRFAQWLSLQPNELPDRLNDWLRLLHAEDRVRVRRELEAHLDSERDLETEFRVRDGSGRWRWLRARGRAQRHGECAPERMSGTLYEVTEEKRSRLQIEEALERFRLLTESVGDVLILKDAEGRWRIANRAALELFGIPVAASDAWEDLTDEEIGEAYPTVAGYLRGSVGSDRQAWHRRTRQTTMERIESAPGTIRVLEISRVPAFDRRGERAAMVIIGRDLTPREGGDRAASADREHAHLALRCLRDGVITADLAGRVTYCNPAAELLTGWPNQEALRRPLLEIACFVDERTREPIDDLAARVSRSGNGLDLDDRILLVNRSGVECAAVLSVAPLRDATGSMLGVVLRCRDVSEQRALLGRLSYQAAHDALTGLLNRRAFEQRLRAMLESMQSNGPGHVLLLLDLDRFKLVNETCGHAAGDGLLRKCAEIVRGYARHNDAVARLGADEFGVVLQNCPLDKAVAIAQKMCRGVSDIRYAWDEHTFRIGVSIGVVVLPRYGGETAEVMVEAGDACYVAKKSRDCVHVSQGADAQIAYRCGEIQWIARLRDALTRQSFVLFAQPIVGLQRKGQEARRYEVLVRLKNRNGKLVGPASFLDAAERYGVISQIDRWVVEHAIDALAAIDAEDDLLAVDSLNINLSGASIGEDSFLPFVKGLLRRHRTLAPLLCFEITETVAIANFRNAMRLMTELKEWGCRFALDDFGSGFSSFGYLKSLPVDNLKIDGSFVQKMVSSEHDAAMVEAINHIGHALHLQTVAEMVGDGPTLHRLRSIGVDFAQGHYLGEPRPLYDVCYAP